MQSAGNPASERIEERAKAAIANLDDVLYGGLLRNGISLVPDPGVGETRLALELSIEGARAVDPCLWVMLGETPAELAATGRAHGGE